MQEAVILGISNEKKASIVEIEDPGQWLCREERVVEVRETPVEVREKERGESVLLKSEAKMKRKVSTRIANVNW